MTFVPTTGPLTTRTGALRGDDAENGNYVAAAVTAFHQTQEPIHGEEFSPALGTTSIGMGVHIHAGEEGGDASDLKGGWGSSVRRLTPT